MRVIVADDEEPARRLVVRLLAQFGGIEVVAEVGDGLAALAAVGRTRPDLLLLDISMPELDGLALATRYGHLPPVVFITAHDDHAVRAFELGAVDYVMKPVELARLALALERARTRGARSLPAPPPTIAPRVVVHDRGAIRVFDAAAIDRFYARAKYTAFVIDGVEQLTEEPLLALEQRLAGHGFQRVHRGELVRLAAVRALSRDGRTTELADGQRVRVSRRFLPALRAALGLA